MAKSHVFQKQRRALITEKKRSIEGDPLTRKLKDKSHQHIAISGKRRRKLIKKWRRDQKEAIDKGLVTLQDVEMLAADGEGSSKEAGKTSSMFSVKKGLKLKRTNRKGKGKGKSKNTAEVSVDAMVE